MTNRIHYNVDTGCIQTLRDSTWFHNFYPWAPPPFIQRWHIPCWQLINSYNLQRLILSDIYRHSPCQLRLALKLFFTRAIIENALPSSPISLTVGLVSGPFISYTSWLILCSKYRQRIESPGEFKQCDSTLNVSIRSIRFRNRVNSASIQTLGDIPSSYFVWWP